MDNKKNYVVQSVPPEALCASNYSSPKKKLSSILSTAKKAQNDSKN